MKTDVRARCLAAMSATALLFTVGCSQEVPPSDVHMVPTSEVSPAPTGYDTSRNPKPRPAVPNEAPPMAPSPFAVPRFLPWKEIPSMTEELENFWALHKRFAVLPQPGGRLALVARDKYLAVNILRDLADWSGVTTLQIPVRELAGVEHPLWDPTNYHAELGYAVDITNLIPRKIARLVGIRPPTPGPNCWNTVGLISGMTFGTYRQTPGDFNSWMQKSTEIFDEEALEPGDILVIRNPHSAFPDGEDAEVHGAIHVSRHLVLTKNGMNEENPYRLQDVEELLGFYLANQPLSCGTLSPDEQCKFRVRYFRIPDHIRIADPGRWRQFPSFLQEAISALAQTESSIGRCRLPAVWTPYSHEDDIEAHDAKCRQEENAQIQRVTTAWLKRFEEEEANAGSGDPVGSNEVAARDVFDIVRARLLGLQQLAEDNQAY